MISFSNLGVRRGPSVLFSGATFQIHNGWKIGLTGRNGCGKSSLMALLLGNLHVDDGDLSMPGNQVVAHVAQETDALPQAAIEFVIDGDQGLRDLERGIAAAEASDDGEKLGTLYAELGTIDGYTARARAARLLDGLGFPAADIERAVSEFSGGFRMRLNLAKALMCRSDLLLLDEPTNHLDLDAILWLEQWLKDYQGTMVLISHDRDFLDNIVGGIMHIEFNKLNLYRGTYSDFERQRAAALEQQQAMYLKQQRERAHIQSFVDRFRAKATKAKQAQSRIKALERMQEIAAAHIDSPFEFSFTSPKQIPNPLLTLDKVVAGYGSTEILEEMSFTIQPGTRVALIGPNGAGKSTLIRTLSGEQAPLSGVRTNADGLRLGYFAQHTLEQIDPSASAVQQLMRLDSSVSDQVARNFLGGFDFHGDQAIEPCAGFSGGEKARLVLALLIWQRPNLLLLDEPTNHLDLEMRHALTMALQDYEGALIVVSHDRHLLRSVTDELWLVADGKVENYTGDLDEYSRWLQRYRIEQQRAQAKGGAVVEKPVVQQPEKTAEKPVLKLSATDRKALRQQEAEVRRQLQPLSKELKQLDKKLEKLSTQQAELETILADETIYEDAQRDVLKQTLAEQVALKKELEQVESRWVEVSEQIETLGLDVS